MRRLVLIAALAAACNQNTINTPIRSFDRPSDVALACVQYDPFHAVFDARPMTDCTPDRAGTESVPGPLAFPDPNTPGNYFLPTLRAMVTQSARGELAMVDVAQGVLVDANRQVPGFGFVPVGLMPEHVRVAPDGCAAATANTDSCDLALVDLNTLYNLPFLPFEDMAAPPGYGNHVVKRVTPAVHGVPLGARPSWIEFSNEASGSRHATDNLGQPGQCTEGRYSAWVALPGCQLVVKVALGSLGDSDGPAEVEQAIRVTRDGAEVVSDLTTLSCPSECSGMGADGGDATPSDGGVDGGRLPTTQAEPATLALDIEGGTGRLFIGDRLSERITIVPIAPYTSELGTPRTLQLEAGALGVSVVRVSPRSEAGKFLYAVARDASVRVIDLDREVECETNPDPRALQQMPPDDPRTLARRLGCFPLGDPSTPRRAPLVTSPGITLPGLALPRDVAFVHVDVPLAPATNVQPPAAGPATLVGDFAWIISSDGHATAVNIFDACPPPNEPQSLTGSTSGPYLPSCDLRNVGPSILHNFGGPPGDINNPGYAGNPKPALLDRVSHRLRPGTARFFNPVNQSDNVGQPRLVNENAQPFTFTIQGLPASSGGDGGTSTLPTLLQAAVSPPPTLPTSTGYTHYLEFVDPDRTRNDTWTLSWEGTIPGTTRALGQIQPGGRLDDNGAAYCSNGVLAGDKLVLTGCMQDTDCDFAQSCVRDPSAPADVTTGLCLDRTNQQSLAMTCSPLLRAVRRYRILSAKQGVAVDASVDRSGVTDELSFAEIYEPEHPAQTHTCVTNDDCKDVLIADPAAGAPPLTTSCLLDVDSQHRCLRACDPTGGAAGADGGTGNGARCGVDFQCIATRFGDHRCALAPVDDTLFAQCTRELQPYEIHTGESFSVVGSLTGYFSDEQANPTTRECEVPPVSSEFVRLHQSRVPLGCARGETRPDQCAYQPWQALAACPPTVVADPLGALPSTFVDPSGKPGNACLVSDTGDRIIHYENPFFGFAVDEPISALVPPDQYALGFQLTGSGFPLSVPLTIDVQAQMPTAAATAPDLQTVFVVDEGKQSVGVGLRGQLLKLISESAQIDRTFVVR